MTAPITCIQGHEYQTAFWNECPTCQAQRNRRLSDLTSEHVRRLQAAMEGGNDQDAHRAAQQLRELGHPDVDGLCRSVQARLDRAGQRSVGRTTRAPASKWSRPDWMPD